MVEIGAGHVIAGKYRLDHRLGEGGMGSVWSAEHLALRSKVAIKLIVSAYADNPTIASRFVREARAAAALRSPHVVQILDYGVDEGLAYIAMEQLEGESLGERLRREHRLSPALTATVVTHVARAIAKAHEAGLVHRDLKPDNVFLIQNDDEIVAKVLDFGVAKTRPDGEGPVSARTETGVVVGSPYYMSPEQARGRSDIDYRSDLWALGVIAFECLVGRRPFIAASMGEVILAICTEPIPVPSAFGAVPPGFDEWFARAAERDVARRFQTPKELTVALRRVLTPGSDASLDGPGRDAVSPVAEPSPAAPPSPPAEPSTVVEPAPAAGAPAAVRTTTSLDGTTRREPGSGKTFGSTTTGPTSHAKSSPPDRTAPAPDHGRRLGPSLAVIGVLAVALAWFAGTRGARDAAPSAASATVALPPALEPMPQSAVSEAPSILPIAAPASVSASAPIDSATVFARHAKTAEHPKAKAAASSTPPKVNPLDIRF